MYLFSSKSNSTMLINFFKSPDKYPISFFKTEFSSSKAFNKGEMCSELTNNLFKPSYSPPYLITPF